MAIDQEDKYLRMVLRGKYKRLYTYLTSLPVQEWRASFREVESVIGFGLPASARVHRPWWGNQRRGNGHSHALAWNVAGWETAEVDMEAETLMFRRRQSKPAPRLSLDEAWPVHPTAVWPEGLSLRREDLYEERVESQSRVEINETGLSIAGYSFKLVGAILPDCDERGEVIAEFPQSRFRNYSNLALNKYGDGPFCRFRVARGWPRGGVYLIMNGDEPLYVGECQNLEDRWGPRGYGLISPRNCYVNGQETNCRINNMVYKTATTGTESHLWFCPVEGGRQTRRYVEGQLVSALNPPWNR